MATSNINTREPFFAHVPLHVLLAAIKELKRYKVERAKYSTFASDLVVTVCLVHETKF